MAKYTLHNRDGDFMSDTARTFEAAKKKCDQASYKCRVLETYFARSAWKPWDEKLIECGKEVYRNY